MSKHFQLFLATLIMLLQQHSRACDELAPFSRQQPSADYFHPWLPFYYRPNAMIPDYVEFDTPFIENFLIDTGNNVDEGNNQVEGRSILGDLGANLINAGLYNNRFTPRNNFRPFANLANRIPFSLNPNILNNPLANFDACTGTSDESGICTSGSSCTVFGGLPNGSCTLGRVCCTNKITKCGSTVTLNNTYWQSPSTTTSAASTCTLTVSLDTKLREQKKPVCQIRLDFVSFTTAQPTAGTCTDTFQVGGASTVVPIICGDNAGQHMYFDVPSSATTPTDVQLMFSFAAGTVTPSWNIKIAMLPCGATYLAPKDCLQYFTSATGKIKSFNWQDVASTATRQLNNQKYNICFRTELLSGSEANEMCVSVCSVKNGGDAFSITTVPAFPPGNTDPNAIRYAATLSAVGTTIHYNPPPDTVVNAVCLYDYLIIAGARDATGIEADRYCGNALNPFPVGNAYYYYYSSTAGGLPTSIQVCTSIRPFKLAYQTDGTEAAIVSVPVNSNTPIAAAADTANTGFCIDYLER